jgi:hypothetical protein
MVPADGGEARRLPADDGGGDVQTVAWAPAADILYRREGAGGFALLAPAARAPRALVGGDAPGWVFHPHYSPDGRRLAVHWDRRDGRGLWLIPLDGGPARLLVKGSYSPIGWSRDGQWIFGLPPERAGDTELFAVRDDGGPVRPWATLPFHRQNLDCSMNAGGDRVVCAVWAVESDLWVQRDFSALLP